MSTFTDVRELGNNLQKYNYEVFKEPRGAMRILQVVFALITALVLRTYEGYISIDFCSLDKVSTVHIPFGYPFELSSVSMTVSCANQTKVVTLMNNFSWEAEFLFNVSWISIVYALIIAFVYVKFREEYESNGNLALLDFGLSLTLAVLWIACFGAWGYGQSELKNLTHPDYLKLHLPACQNGDPNFINCLGVARSGVSALTESLILAFLNFFLWAAGLWFTYKETPWYLQFQRT